MTDPMFPKRIKKTWRAALLLLALLPAAAPTFAQPGAPFVGTFARYGHRYGHGSSCSETRDCRVGVGHDVDLPADEHAGSVVAVFGSATVEGQASGDVVAVLGSARATGPVAGDVVSILGTTYIDSHVSGDAVAVLGSLQLGPHAEIDGDAQAVGGQLRRDPGAIVHGEVGQAGPNLSLSLAPITPWLRHALLYLRPLAIGPGLGWAWVVAGIFLALYLLLAFLAPRGIERCVQSLELHPGPTLLAALVAMLLTPPLLLLLVVTVIGIAAVPVVMLALFCALLFGKAAALAWLGGRFLGRRAMGAAGARPAAGPLPVVLAVALGGVIVLALYLVPVLGLIVYKLLGLLGLGMVVHALILAARERRRAGRPTAPPPHIAPTAGTVAAAAPGSAASEATGPELASPGMAPPAPLPVDPTLPRAGFWIRMAALLLDTILVGIVLGLLRWHHLILPVLACYGAILWKTRGATLGGIVFDLRVVRADGQAMDWTTVIVRALGCFLSLAALGLGFFWIAFDENRQAWHDKFAGTLVVRATQAGAPLRA